MKSTRKKPDEVNKKITSYSTHPIWPTIPGTVKLLQKSRATLKTDKLYAELHQRIRGVNATIILLSATCIEGFLVECLLSYTIGYRFATKDTFQRRLDLDFLKNISKATFKDFPELFTLTLGIPLSELITDKPLLESVRTLIDFRNGIAHGRSISYETYATDLGDDVDYEMENQYKAIHAYLTKNKFVYRHEDILKNEIADHFAGIVKPYIDVVIPLLPEVQSDNVKSLVKWANREYPI